MTEEGIVPLTQETLQERTRILGELVNLLFAADDQGRIGLEKGYTRLELTRDNLDTLYKWGLNLGLSKDQVKQLSDNRRWQDFCDKPVLFSPNNPGDGVSGFPVNR